MIKAGVVTFRYTEDNIELLLIRNNNIVSHVLGQQIKNETIAETALRNLHYQTGLNLLVISLEPVFIGLQSIKEKGNKTHEEIHYYAGISNPRQNVALSDDNLEYLWVDHLGGRNTITRDIDIKSYENARNWLYENDEAALFLANYLEMLQI